MQRRPRVSLPFQAAPNAVAVAAEVLPTPQPGLHCGGCDPPSRRDDPFTAERGTG